MSDDVRCPICEATFRAESMDGEKCKECSRLYPNARTREDIKAKGQDKAKTLSEETVKEIIYGILEEAGWARSKCEKCDGLYYKKSPAQKTCSKCKSEGTD